MTTLWVVYCLLTSLLVGLAALLAEHSIRLWTQRGRWVWFAALYGAVIFAMLPWLLPASRGSSIGWGISPIVASISREVARSSPVSEVSHTSPAEAAIGGQPGLDSVLRVGWIVSIALAFLVLGISWVRLRRRCRGFERVTLFGTSILVSDGLGPAVIGFLRPTIVLPRWTLEAPPATRDLILAHEKAHVEAHDQRLLGFSLLACTLVAWNPVVWWYLGRLRQAIELDCDARVLRSGANVRAYGTLLLNFSRYPREAPPLLTALAEPISHLERRIKAIGRTRPHRRLLRSSAATFTSGFLVVTACETPRPSTSETTEPKRLTLSVVAAQQWLPRPDFARQLRQVIAERHPRVYNRGHRGDEALWIVVDRDDRILDSWVGRAYSDQRWREFRQEGRFRGLSLVPWLFDVRDRTGRPIAIVWAKPRRTWTYYQDPLPELDARIRAEIQRRGPSFLTGSVPDGQAIWVLDRTGGKRENLLRNPDIWVAPVIADPKARWEHLRARLPKTSDVMLRDLRILSAGGDSIPVIFGSEIEG